MKMTKTNKKVIAIILSGVAIMLAVIVGLLVYRHNSKILNLDKYLEITVDGYDGYGTAEAKINWKQIRKDYDERLIKPNKVSKYAETIFGKELTDAAIDEILKDAISVDLSASDNLSNGDEIEYKWDVDEDIDYLTDLNIKAEGGTYKVDALKDIEKYDVFKHVKLEVTGLSPYCEASVSYDGKYFTDADFHLSADDDLADGDKVVATLDVDIKSFSQCGVAPKETSKEFTVKTSQKYAEKSEEFSDELKAEMKSQADDVVTEYIAIMTENRELVSSEYVGNYFRKAKVTDEEYQNSFGLVYKITFKISNDYTSEEVTNYFDVIYYNISINEDDSSDYEATQILAAVNDEYDYHDVHNNIPRTYKVEISNGDKNGTYDWFKFYGFESLKELKRIRIDMNAAGYTSEWNVEE